MSNWVVPLPVVEKTPSVYLFSVYCVSFYFIICILHIYIYIVLICQLIHLFQIAYDLPVFYYYMVETISAVLHSVR